MAINLSSILLVRLSRSKTGCNIFGAVKKFHHESVNGMPEVPFIELHDPSNFFIVTENGSPLQYFKPDLSELDAKSLKQRTDLAVHNFFKLRERLLQRSSEVYLVLFPKDKEARVSPVAAFRNYVVYINGFRADMLSIAGKLKPNTVNDFGAKISELSSKLPVAAIQERWKRIKEKLPDWQKAIAAKLQTIQDNINKKIK